jgi:hypothetical protein
MTRHRGEVDRFGSDRKNLLDDNACGLSQLFFIMIGG